MDRFIVVSSDCHAGLQPLEYRAYLDAPFRELFDLALPLEIAAREEVEKSFLIKEINEQWRRGNETALTGAWDHAERMKVLDKDGIAAEIIFPDGITERNAPPFGVGLAPSTRGARIPPMELIYAGSRAHNRWLAEFCELAPERRIGVGVVPLVWSVEEGVKELETLVKRNIRQVMIPTITGDFESYNHAKYDPFWAACHANDVVINFHSGAGPMEDLFGKSWPTIDKRSIGAVGMFASEIAFWTFRPIAHMIWGGVFERFPNLKAMVTEIGGGGPALATLLAQWDHVYNNHQSMAKMGDFCSHLSRAPSEYFHRNVGLGASVILPRDIEMRHQIGIEKIMWGSDYPHPEGTWPHTRKKLYETFAGLPENDIALMLGENAIKFFGLDRDKLAKIAERIGPKKSDFVAG